MSIFSSILTLVQTLQALYSASLIYKISLSIQNLRVYEETSEKAAEWSNTAANQLYQTRVTQASAVASLLVSLGATLFLLFSAASPLAGIAVSFGNAVILFLAYSHVGDFWRHKAKVPLPGVGQYNDAISQTNDVRVGMAFLMCSWVSGGIISAVMGMVS